MVKHWISQVSLVHWMAKIKQCDSELVRSKKCGPPNADLLWPWGLKFVWPPILKGKREDLDSKVFTALFRMSKRNGKTKELQTLFDCFMGMDTVASENSEDPDAGRPWETKIRVFQTWSCEAAGSSWHGGSFSWCLGVRKVRSSVPTPLEFLYRSNWCLSARLHSTWARGSDTEKQLRVMYEPWNGLVQLSWLWETPRLDSIRYSRFLFAYTSLDRWVRSPFKQCRGHVTEAGAAVPRSAFCHPAVWGWLLQKWALIQFNSASDHKYKFATSP